MVCRIELNVDDDVCCLLIVVIVFFVGIEDRSSELCTSTPLLCLSFSIIQ